MLIPIDEFITNPLYGQPKNRCDEVFQNAYRQFYNAPWFVQLYKEVHPYKNKIVIKSSSPLRTDMLPSLFEGHQIKYIWDGKRNLTLEEAAMKYAHLNKNKNWFDYAYIENDQIWVKMKYQMHDLPDYYEDYEIRFTL